MIRTDQISYQIGDKKLIDRIDLCIEPGKVLVILGANGAGKSTLLNCLSAGIYPQTGSVLWNEIPVRKLSLKEQAKYRAVLSQSNEIRFPFKVIDLVSMGRYPYHIRANEWKEHQEIVNSVLEYVEIIHLKDRIYQSLSGGEKQRVHLARALAQIWTSNTPFLFLDEPVNALDLKYQQMVFDLVLRLKEERQASIICVLHDLNLAFMYADAILVLKQGKNIAFGEPSKVLTKEIIYEAYGVFVDLIDIGRAYPFICLKNSVNKAKQSKNI